ncbi:thiol-activated cytolysin family protein [Flagellimonas meishanensis]|uniref:thiol-activated cytolysin family protein n=1 Tax=Flagellimonas meishanensis TaxID=2873264 RepID=UPI001CA7AE5E|nr:thiol-activated cytolysin family protein [[Muricauda] meishanensis]
MKTMNRLPIGFFLATIVLIALSCSKDDNGPSENPEPTTLTFEEVIALGSEPASFPDGPTEEIIEDLGAENEAYQSIDSLGNIINDFFVCSRKTISILDGNPEFPLFDTNAEVIYPGNLLQGKTLSNATPSPIVVKRGGGTISYNLNIGNGTDSSPIESSFTVDEVKRSTIQEAMNAIIGDGTGMVPDDFILDIKQIESENQLAIEMGVDVNTFTTRVSADMSFSTDKQYNRMLVKLQQSFYTMVFDLPTSLEDFFDESVTPEQLSVYVQEDNPATFISSVNYGRIFYMLVESTSSREEMDTKLDFAYGAFEDNVSGEVKVEAFNELKDVKIKVIAYGGTGSARLAGESNISAIVDRLAESTDIRSGLPLSYVVRSVERPDIVVGTTLATTYDTVDCVNISKGLPVYTNLRSNVQAALYGGINTQTWGNAVDTPSNLLFDSNNFFVHINDQGETSGEYSLGQIGPDGVAGYPFSGIGAAAFRPQGPGFSNGILFFNPEGTMYLAYLINSTNGQGVFLGADSIGSLGSGLTFDAIGAAMDVSFGGRQSLLCVFNKEGTHYSIREGGVFQSARSIADFQIKTNGSSFEIPFESVGAAMRVNLPDTESRTLLAIFNAAGTQYVFFDIDNDGFIGPFDM